MVRAVEPPVLAEPYRTERRLALQAEARDFAMNEVLPVANELDPQKAEMPPELVKKMGALGYFGIRLPEEVGGLGLGVFEYCMIAEELARAWMSVASIIARAQGMGTGHATGERRLELLRRSAAGDWIGAAALSEPTAGSDLAGVRTPRRAASATSGCSTGRSGGAATRSTATSSSCCAVSATPVRGRAARPG